MERVSHAVIQLGTYRSSSPERGSYRMSSTNVEEQLLKEIVGQKLEVVNFVMDYMILSFGQSALSVYTWPSIRKDDVVLGWNDDGYGDLFRRQIGHSVTSVGVTHGEAIKVLFDNGVEVFISLRDKDYVTAEAAKFDSTTGAWWVL